MPQNDTELFPSGGLISSYAVVTFDRGEMKDVQLEYFGTLYDRWQAKTKEYIEPPAPLQHAQAELQLEPGRGRLVSGLQ